MNDMNSGGVSADVSGLFGSSCNDRCFACSNCGNGVGLSIVVDGMSNVQW